MATTLSVLAPAAAPHKLAAMQQLSEETAPNRLREMRLRAGLSQADLGAEIAERLGRDTPIAQQQVAVWEKGGEMKLSVLRAAADVLQCAEQDLIGKPLWPSTEGWTSAKGQAPKPDLALLQRATLEAQTMLEQTGRRVTPDKFAALVASFYDLALDTSARYGVPLSEVDLRPYWRLMTN